MWRQAHPRPAQRDPNEAAVSDRRAGCWSPPSRSSSHAAQPLWTVRPRSPGPAGCGWRPLPIARRGRRPLSTPSTASVCRSALRTIASPTQTSPWLPAPRTGPLSYGGPTRSIAARPLISEGCLRGTLAGQGSSSETANRERQLTSVDQMETPRSTSRLVLAWRPDIAWHVAEMAEALQSRGWEITVGDEILGNRRRCHRMPALRLHLPHQRKSVPTPPVREPALSPPAQGTRRAFCDDATHVSRRAAGSCRPALPIRHRW
jgi:hypothetical protein